MHKKLIAGVMAISLGTAVYVNSKSAGVVPIPEDLLPEYEQAMQQIQTHEQAMQQPVNVINEILRRTIDRAGVKVGDYEKYSFDRACKCLKVKEQK